MMRRVMSMVAACGLGLALASPAAAVVREVEGGIWDAGENSSVVWSYYNHPTRWHGSSVQAAGGRPVRSDCKGPRETARASTASTWGVDKAYYRFCV